MALYRWVISGALPSGDSFQFGAHITASGAVSAQDQADAVQTSWDQHFPIVHNGKEAARAQFTSGTVFDKVTVYEVLASGGPSLSLAEKALTSRTGSGSGNPLPPQVSIAASLLTATPGRQGRGRMYLPAPYASANATTGRMQVATRDSIAEFLAAWFGDINTLASGRTVDVLSRVGQVARPVTRVVVGDVYDTQRRRRDALLEVPYSVDVSQV